MAGRRAIALAAVPVALLGCGSGCDGERAKRPVEPHEVVPPAPGDAGVAVVEPNEPGVEVAPGLLDAPAGTLDAVYKSLAAAERGDASGRTLLLFFGDSHTAGDSMTSRLRATLQSRFGDGGRGLVAAGRPPTRHYYQRDVRYGASGSWKASVGGHRGDAEPFGIDGLRVFGDRKGSQLWVETCPDCQAGTSVAQLEILYYAAPDHGVLRYRVDDGAWQQLATKTQPIEPPHPARTVVTVPDGPHKLLLEHGGQGPLDLFGVVMERTHPGVIVDSLGVVGRRLGSLRSWDWSIIGEQLSTRDPRLVVLQYGTNEADDPDLDLEQLAKYYDETILRIRSAAPTASILILGPPDMGAREAGKACDKPPRPSRAPPRVTDSGGRPRTGTPPDAGVIPECEWKTPNVLGRIIAVEHAAALRNHVAFFDTFAAMGGGDRMHEWVLAEPKVAYKDHVHFTDVGYQRWADLLSGALLAEYDRWRHAPTPPPSQPVSAAPPAAPSSSSGAMEFPAP
jgi:lysophospholipase L1-like esterase